MVYLTDDERLVALWLTNCRWTPRRDPPYHSNSDDGKWMDVELAEADDVEHLDGRFPVITAVAPDRLGASVQIANIVAALELQTS